MQPNKYLIYKRMVKKQMKNVALALILMAATTVGLNAAQKGDNAMTKMADGSYVVNTTTLALPGRFPRMITLTGTARARYAESETACP